MRLPRVVAGLTLIVALALVAVPGRAGTRTPSADPRLDPTLFQRVEAATAAREAATADFTLDPAVRSEGSLEPGSTLVEAGGLATPERVSAAVPTPRRREIAKGVVAGVGFVATTSGWRRDPEISWYGPGFYGNRTACGKTLTKTLLGVAHRSLPCGTMVSFRNPSNGRVVTVPVVDRGPYVAGRQWDLTAGACRVIAHCYTGPIQWRFA